MNQVIWYFLDISASSILFWSTAQIPEVSSPLPPSSLAFSCLFHAQHSSITKCLSAPGTVFSLSLCSSIHLRPHVVNSYRPSRLRGTLHAPYFPVSRLALVVCDFSVCSIVIAPGRMFAHSTYLLNRWRAEYHYN
jgi:hypothetical protein